MTLGAPLGLPLTVGVGAALAALVVLAYFLKLRRRRFEVPFSKLWERVLGERDTTSLWRRLQRLLSLLVQLAFLGLTLGAVLDPRVGETRAAGRDVVLIVDASASMKALDLGPDAPSRLERAKADVRRLLDGLGGGDAAMVIQMDGQPTALSRFEPERAHLRQVVGGIEASDTSADLVRALATAADALRGRRRPLVVIFGDGAYPEAATGAVAWEGTPALGQVDMSGIDVRFVPIGKATRNVGITAFNVRRYVANKLSYEVLVELGNFGDAPETVKLTLFSGDDPAFVKSIELAAGERRREIYPDLGGGDDRALRAQLEPATGKDAFPLDDTAWALLPERRRQRVLLVTDDNLYLEGALLLDANVTVDKVRPREYAARSAAGPYDVVVFDGVTPDAPPSAPGAVYLDPRGPASPVAIRGELARPIVAEAGEAKEHPVLRWVTFLDVHVDRSSVFAPAPGDVVLARSIRDPVVVAGRRGATRIVAFGFGLGETDLTMRVAFPVLVVNMLDWFAGDDSDLITTYRTGDMWSIPVEGAPTLAEVTVRGSHGTWKAPVQHGRARFAGRRAGLYRVEGGDTPVSLAANLADPSESRLTPSPTLTLGGRKLADPPSFSPSVTRSLWIPLVLLALILATVEWLTYHRRITV